MSAVTLYQFPPVGGLPSMSPFCLKVHIALRKRELDFGVVNTLFPGKYNPAGKLPVLRRGDETLIDSSAIIAALDEGADQPFTPADPEQRARARLLEDWADESLFWHALYFKFEDDDGWSRFGKALGECIPWPIRAIGLLKTRRHHRAMLRMQGLARRPPGQREAEFETLLDSLDALLSKRDFLVGESMTIADIAVAGMLLPLMTGLTPKPEAEVRKRKALGPWLDRGRLLLAT